MRSIHLPHAARTELFQDAIVGESLTEHGNPFSTEDSRGSQVMEWLGSN